MSRIEVPGRDIVGIRAANPGPFTLSGTNSWIVGRAPAWLVDPGPALDDHVEALAAEIEARGGLGGIALTHDHPDHTEAVPAILERFPDASVGAARGEVGVRAVGAAAGEVGVRGVGAARGEVGVTGVAALDDGSTFGPFEAVATPGHAPDHLAFVTGDVVMTGDAVLGEGSVFIWPDPGALAGYLEALAKLGERPLAIICPGHGPLVRDPSAKLEEYISHRLEREQRLLVALNDGKRSAEELLEEVWDDAPAVLRPAAAATLAAHLDKLVDEGRLPPGVERPPLPQALRTRQTP